MHIFANLFQHSNNFKRDANFRTTFHLAVIRAHSSLKLCKLFQFANVFLAGMQSRVVSQIDAF